MPANNKRNNNTKKAKKRAALIAKMKANINNPKKPPRPIFEEPSVTKKRNAVRAKFHKNLQNRTKKN
jgi:hypothetical protein